jgi:hypothetical protein
MKKILLFIVFACAPFFLNAVCTAQVTTTQVTCYNGCNGTATVTPSGGTPPYTYLWGPGGQTTQTVNGLCAGNYSVNIIDSVGCSATLFFNITQPTQILPAYTTQAATCSTCCDGSATANPTGGNAPYTYSWFPSGNTNATESNLCPGTYSFTVTDSSGCIVGSLFTIANSMGIHDPGAIENLSVYPSPANQSVTVNGTFANPTSAEISVCNLPGEIVFVKALSSSARLNETIRIAELPDGIYFITVKTASGTSVQKFVKQ